ncbi:Small ribosomal subunit biogenesis [Dimargaris xerosporica]|nr:Small ribosomal subunit biogenesis [Dimargaris xerosporica]
MVLQVSNANNVKVYTVCGSAMGRKIPEWMVQQKKKELKKDRKWQTRVELIQDFDFPTASNRIRVTNDGQYVMATGVYKPRLRVFEYSDMSMKFERYTDAENVNFAMLSDDWTKSVHLQADRSLQFHTQDGVYYSVRVPTFGRDLAYHHPSCDVLVTAAKAEVYRLNLDQGRFMKPLVTSSTAGVNVVDINPAHQLFGFGTEDGFVEFWDPRVKSHIGTLIPSSSSASVELPASYEISALKFHTDGLSVAVGTSTGQVMLYDLRHARPYLTKDHNYELPIKSLNWHTASVDTVSHRHKIISADPKAIRIWDKDTGKPFTTIQPKNRDINDVCHMDGTGMLFVANEGPEMLGYYIPALGPAPSWCAFLDNLTEEMEETPQESVYEDYKFTTREELAILSLDHLIGTNLLRAYMHGYFIKKELYEKARAIANPLAFEEYKQRRVQERLDKQRRSRIRANPS